MGLDIELLFSLAVFALVTSVTPGPNNLMVMASGAAFGVRRTVPHVAGIALGFASMIGAAVFGLGALLEAFRRVEGDNRLIATSEVDGVAFTRVYHRRPDGASSCSFLGGGVR